MLGIVLTATVVPGVFIIDDDNYLMNVLLLRQGRVTVGNTEGLTPSRELLSFDPGPWARGVNRTPVASTAPPLYAPMALPFLVGGWRGLVALNTLAYLATILLVFAYTKRFAASETAPWLAAGAFAFGGYAIEYAQGLWPQALSFALCTAGVWAIGRLIDDGGARWAFGAGLLFALATGVRYQNAILLAAGGTAALLWSRERIRVSFAIAAGAIGPLAASAAFNHARLGSWNPISKGPRYLNLQVAADAQSALIDPAVMFWARVVDFAARPPLIGPLFTWVAYDPSSGAHLMSGETVQKAFLQSAPWAIVALLAFAAAWLPATRFAAAQRRQLRWLALVSATIIVTFAFSGVTRTEGLAYNQRYLLELLPGVAIGFGWAMDGVAFQRPAFAAGATWGALLAVAVLFALPAGSVQWMLILKIPVLLAAATGVLWLVARSNIAQAPLLLVAVSVCLGWGLAVHVGDDVRASHRRRAFKRMETAALAGAIGDHTALVTYWGGRDSAIPLLFDRDVVILDAMADEGRDAPVLIRQLLAQNRRVFINQTGFPRDMLARVLDGLSAVPVARPGVSLLEVRRSDAL